MSIILLLTWAALAALVAFVYSQILTDSGMILNGWFNWLDRLLGPASAKTTYFEVPGLLPGDPPKKASSKGKPRALWLFKPLVGCCRCVAGQFGAWGYLIVVHKLGVPYSGLEHVIFTSFAIYAVKFIAQFYQWNP